MSIQHLCLFIVLGTWALWPASASAQANDPSTKPTNVIIHINSEGVMGDFELVPAPGQPAQPPRPGQPGQPMPPHMIFRAATRPLVLEKAAYLGVATTPPPPVLRSQLKLTPGTGLVVDSVQENSPAAAAGLKKHDVVTKLNDQILVNREQLAVLVRAMGAGKEVILTVIRDGQSQEIKAKLVEKELPPLGLEMEDEGHFRPRAMPPMIQPPPTAPGAIGGGFGGPGDGAGFGVAQGQAVIADGEHTITINMANGSRTAHVVDKAGKVVFDGPIDTEEQLKAVPDAICAKITAVKINGGVNVGGMGGMGGGIIVNPGPEK